MLLFQLRRSGSYFWLGKLENLPVKTCLRIALSVCGTESSIVWDGEKKLTGHRFSKPLAQLLIRVRVASIVFIVRVWRTSLLRLAKQSFFIVHSLCFLLVSSRGEICNFLTQHVECRKPQSEILHPPFASCDSVRVKIHLKRDKLRAVFWARWWNYRITKAKRLSRVQLECGICWALCAGGSHSRSRPAPLACFHTSSSQLTMTHLQKTQQRVV